jgi:hypothetical protein
MPPSDNAPFLVGLKRCFTRIELAPDAGLIARRGVVPEDRLARIRRSYFWEAVGVFLLVMAVVWCEYWLDKAGTKTFRVALGAPVMLWMFVLSPLAHCRFDGPVFLQPHQQWNAMGWYFWEFRGLGNPLRYYVGANGQPPLIIKHWRAVAAVMAAMTLLYVSAAFNFSKEIDERYAQHYAAFGGKIGFILFLLCVIDLAWLFLAVPFMVRLDNLARSVRFIVAFMIGTLLLIFLYNLFFQFVLEPHRAALEGWHYIRLRGEPSGERLSALLHPLAIGGQWSGYVTWGWFQQFIFASYFGVLFGRAFPVEQSRAELMKAVLCTAACFSLVHLPNVWLMVFTFTGGIFGTLLFYQMFNLFALGFSHGFGGSLLNQLTPINFSVGPSQMRGH